MRTVTLIGPGGEPVRTWVPTTMRERMRGLLDRSELGRDEALLLEGARSVHTIGMRFPIAVAYLDGHLCVLEVRAVPPNRVLRPRLRARHVLECSCDAELRAGDRLRMVAAPAGSTFGRAAQEEAARAAR